MCEIFAIMEKKQAGEGLSGLFYPKHGGRQGKLPDQRLILAVILHQDNRVVVDKDRSPIRIGNSPEQEWLGIGRII